MSQGQGPVRPHASHLWSLSTAWSSRAVLLSSSTTDPEKRAPTSSCGRGYTVSWTTPQNSHHTQHVIHLFHYILLNNYKTYNHNSGHADLHRVHLQVRDSRTPTDILRYLAPRISHCNPVILVLQVLLLHSQVALSWTPAPIMQNGSQGIRYCLHTGCKTRAKPLIFYVNFR